MPVSISPKVNYDVRMRKPIHITTPRPGSEEVARLFRIPRRRQKELNALAEKFVRRLHQAQEASDGKSGGKGKKRKNASAAA